MVSRILIDVMWVCQCCMLCHANGECCDGGHDREPLNRIEPGESVTMGLASEEHSEYCTGDECDCERIEFSTYPCEGCGTSLHGDRYAFTLWQD